MIETVGDLLDRLSAYRRDAKITFATSDGEVDVVSIYDDSDDDDGTGDEVVIDLELGEE